LLGDLAALLSLPFIGLGKDHAFALVVPTGQLLQRVLAQNRLLDPGSSVRGGVAGARQGHEIIILRRLQFRAGGQGGHLAIAGIQQALLPQLLTDAADQREIQRVIRRLARYDVAGQEVAGGLGGGGHELELWQIGTMILAVAALHDAVRGDGVIAKRGGTIEPDAVVGDFRDFAGGLPEVRFEGWPISILESAEDNAQAIIGELDGAERLAEESLQGVAMVACPVLDTDLAVVGLGEKEGQPDSG
jgi:hypothetical protein